MMRNAYMFSSVRMSGTSKIWYLAQDVGICDDTAMDVDNSAWS